MQQFATTVDARGMSHYIFFFMATRAALMQSSVLKPLLKKDVVDYGIINSECVAHALSDILFSMRKR